MKLIAQVGLLLLLYSIQLSAQKSDFNTKKGYAVKGYDVVAYFDGQAIKGSKKFVSRHNHQKYKFSTKANLDTFEMGPDKFLPQYGGWCAYGMGVAGKKYRVNPKTFEIKHGKLYLFFDTFYFRSFKKWNENDPELLRKKADKYWSKSSNAQS